LQAIKIPPVGGDTLWSSGVAAFAALDQSLQQKLKGLTATHDIRQSFPIERFAHNDVERKNWKKPLSVIHPLFILW
jgi:taurine dioxygenase